MTPKELVRRLERGEKYELACDHEQLRACPISERDEEIARLREIVAGVDDGGHWYSQQTMDARVAEIARLTAELEKCRENAERLVPHAKWLRECGLEIAHAGHYGWANTLTMAADAIDAARSKP